MSSSERVGQSQELTAFCVTSDPTVEITVHDAHRTVCGRGEGSVRLSLPPGLYSVLFERGGVVDKQVVDHEDTTDLVHRGPPLRSPAPLASAATSHDYIEPARRQSLEDTDPPLGNPPHTSRLFLFLRRTQRDADPRKLPSEPVTIHDVDGRPLATVSRDNAQVDDDNGHVVFSCKAAPGTYRVRSGRSRRDIAITIPAERAAHVFVVDTGVVRLDELRVSLVPIAAPFDPASATGIAMESVIAALRVPDHAFPASARALLPDAADKDLCFGIAAAHLLWRCQDRAAFTAVMQRLAKYREIPDVAILDQLDRSGQPAVAGPVSPPLLRASLLATTQSELDAYEIPDRCALAQAARTGLHDSIWCTWSARTWDERWIEATVEQLRSRDRHRDAASIARSLALPTSTIAQALQALSATTPSSNGRALDSAEVVVPGYTLGEVLGRGAQSTVFRATRQGDERAVALKIMPLRGGADACARVLRELEQSQRVDHPRILAPTALGALPGDTGIWFEMELCRGSVLDQLSQADAPLSVSEAHRIVLDALEGLAELHRRGIVHGDLKPGNLLVRQDGSVVLADLGLTRCLANAMQPLAAARAPRFTPPELLAGEVPVERASDVWAMAATLHFLLTLEPPRDEYASQSQLDAAKHNPIIPLATRRPDVPPELARCVDRALSHKMSARPTDAADLRAQLTSPGWFGLKPWLTISLAIVVAVAASLLAVKIFSREPIVIIRDGGTVDASNLVDASPTVEWIRISVNSKPQDAEVLLRTPSGSASLGRTPVHTKLRKTAANASLVVRKPGFESVTKKVDLTRDVDINITLNPIPPPQPEITIKIDSEPRGADVRLCVPNPLRIQMDSSRPCYALNAGGAGASGARLLGTTPLLMKMPKGKGLADLVVTKQNFKPVLQHVDLTHDIELKVTLEADIPQINITVDSDPSGAAVLLKTSTGTTSLGTTPLYTKIAMGARRASLVVQKTNCDEFEQPVDLTHDINIKAKLSPTIK